LFKRTPSPVGGKVGDTVANMYHNLYQIYMTPGANDIGSGIAKVTQYLALVPNHEHPITGMANSPHIFVSSGLSWWHNEITEYYWKKNSSGDETDVPIDKNDHAMDTTKYLLTNRPKLATYVGKSSDPPAYLSWHEIDRNEATTLPRHK